VNDNQFVKEGDVLVEIDPRDYQTALSQAKANVTTAHSQLDHAQAEVLVSEAKVVQAQATLTAVEAQDKKANNDLGRYQSVEARAVSKTDFDQAQAQALAADANVDASHAQVKAAQADVTLSRADVESANANLAEAQAKLEQAQLDLSYTNIIAPRDGRVTARSVQLGNYVQAGQALLVIVPKDVWVVANFKETQLAHMRPGQPVELTLDAYPGKKFKGNVDSLQAGSGARFSLLPPENAVGNYVKVVQRIPVKIIFSDPLPDNLDIAPGMSVNPTVKVK
jgi:membrane fusion protein (multidrug efflux system)